MKRVSNLLKSFGLIFMLLTLCTVTFAKAAKSKKVTTPPPQWLSDYEEMYPHDKYIAAVGLGESAENAIANAKGQVASFFQSEIKRVVNAQTKMAQEISGDQSITIKKDMLTSDITIATNITLPSIETLSPYYDKKEDQYYALCFLDKNKTFTIFDEEVTSARGAFLATFKNAQKESNSLKALQSYKVAVPLCDKLLECAYKASCLAPSPDFYKEDFLRKGVLLDAMQKAKKNVRFFINIFTSGESEPLDNKTQKTIESSIAKSFSDAGFVISKTPTDYLIDTYISLDMSSENSDDLVMYTYRGGSISVSLKYMIDNSTCYTYKGDVGTKYASYRRDKVYQKVQESIVSSIGDGLTNDIIENF